MRVLVCGGRAYDPTKAAIWLNRHVPVGVTMVIHGGAEGADKGADQWARLLGLPLEVYPADWDTHGQHPHAQGGQTGPRDSVSGQDGQKLGTSV